MVTLTDSAKEYLKSVGKPNVLLSVKGGGCSGFQYEWGTTDKDPTIGNLYIDPIAEFAIFGCTVDCVLCFILHLFHIHFDHRDDERSDKDTNTYNSKGRMMRRSG